MLCAIIININYPLTKLFQFNNLFLQFVIKEKIQMYVYTWLILLMLLNSNFI